MASLKRRAELRRHEDDRLYEEYGRPLEKDHAGELAAIGPNGHILFGLGKNPGELLRVAADAFGKGRFAFRRVGSKAVWRWLSLRR